MGLVVVTVAAGGLPVVETPGGYPVAEGQMGVPVTKVTGKYGWPVTYTGGSGPPNWSSTIFPGSLQITGQDITPAYDIHAYVETITASVVPVDGQTITPAFSGGSGNTTVTAPNGMSWTFPGAVTNGTYVNGDVWVYTTTTLPMPTLSTPASGTGASTRNGGMINPTFNTLVETSPIPNQYTTAMQQGFDGRAIENASIGYPPILDYNAAYNAHTNGSVLSPGDSLVSCESLNDAEYAAITSNKRAIWKMAVLTVVNYTPNTDEFRPPYFGTTKTRRRFSELNTALLPNRTVPYNPKGTSSDAWHIDESSVYVGATDTTNLPVLTRIQEMEVSSARHLQWFITPQRSSRSTFSLLSPATGCSWYPRDRGTAWGRLACYVLHNFADRDLFLTRLVQIAIDGYAVAVGRVGSTPFSNGAGFFITPLWLIRFAGLLFNDTGMKNAASMTTGKTDFFGNALPYWGEQIRTYFNASAHAQYLRPAGYTGVMPTYGDMAFQDCSAGQSSNGTYRYPGLIYDVYPYREVSAEWYGTVAANSADGTTIKLDAASGSLADGYFNGRKITGILDGTEYQTTITVFVAATQVCTVSPAFPIAPDNNDKFRIQYAAYPNILASSYVDLPDPNSPGQIGSYMAANHYAHMGSFMASVIMADEAAWGGDGSIPAFNRRFANDPQMWEGWGINFDYSDIGTAPKKYYRDLKGFGGSGNGWMCDLWDELTITPSSLPIVGQTIADVYAPGSTTTTIFTQALNANDTGYENYTLRILVPVSAGAGTQVQVTFEAHSGSSLSIDNASIGISTLANAAASSGLFGDFDTTATPVELLFNGGSHGVTMTAGTTKTSDPVNLTGFTSTQLLVVTWDASTTNGNPRVRTGLSGVIAGGVAGYLKASSNSYNLATTPTGGTILGGQIFGFNKIEKL